MAKGSDNPFPSVLLDEQGAAPTTPASGFWRVYAKSDGLYVVDDAGSETGPLGTGGGGGTIIPSTNDGRLTLTTAVPVTVTDVTAATTVYWALYKGAYIALYDGASTWTLHALAEKSLSLAGLLPHSIHDIFMDYNSGTPVLASLPWTAGPTGPIASATNATPIVIGDVAHGLSTGDVVTISGVGGNTAANGTFRITAASADTFSLQTLAGANVAGDGAYTSGGTWYKSNYTGTRATALTKQNGVYVLTGATDWRYLGTVRITSTAGQTEDSLTKRFLWNYDHRLLRHMFSQHGTSWTYATATWRYPNNDQTGMLGFVRGVDEDPVLAHYELTVSPASGAESQVAVGIDDATPEVQSLSYDSGAIARRSRAIYNANLSAGYHFVAGLEFGLAGTTTYYMNFVSGNYNIRGGLFNELMA